MTWKDKLIFVSAQPDVPYFHWQCEVYLNNFIERIEKQKSIITVRGYKDEYTFTTSSDWLEFPKDGEDRTELLQLDHGLPKDYSVVNVERNTIGDEIWIVEKVK